MAKFRITLGIVLILFGPALFYIALDAEQQGINLAEPDGTRGAALFDVLGKWGMLLVCVGVGISEVLTGKSLLNNKDDND